MALLKRVRRLRHLKIDDVSSVDRGAGERVKVLLAKRDANKEGANMDTDTIVSKAFKNIAKDDTVAIAKAANDVLDDLTAITMAKNPGVSWDKARVLAMDTPAYSALHRMEKSLKHGAGY